MIHFLTPYSKGNLGEAYNESIAKIDLGEKDWVCLMDGDVMFLNENWGDIIHSYVKDFGEEYGLLTCLTNRIFETSQLYGGKVSPEPNILRHKSIADRLGRLKGSVVETASNISGFLMLFPASTICKVGTFKEGILGVDNDFCRRVRESGLKVGVMQTLYMFHFYRLHKNISDKSHLR